MNSLNNIQRSTPYVVDFKKNELLLEAARRGETDKVKSLILLCDPTFERSKALTISVIGGHIDCVKILIPVSDLPNSPALSWAVEYGRIDCVDLLVQAMPENTDFFPHLTRCIQKGDEGLELFCYFLPLCGTKKIGEIDLEMEMGMGDECYKILIQKHLLDKNLKQADLQQKKFKTKL